MAEAPGKRQAESQHARTLTSRKCFRISTVRLEKLPQAPAKSGASASGGRISDGHTLSDWVPNPKTQPNPGPVRLAPPEILHTFV